ncbi:uncharacterized protein LOC122368142 [Amphibalanus amphitrite]|uniref:uncharacterized protein LOC122368142 n=1 Tax=Amphibalanus amphitrite TaxID=1232801 RepID=UPI001C8FE833|nr:uncharacterized protein LOC122368142 [Amphibalanus amphitrite]
MVNYNRREPTTEGLMTTSNVPPHLINWNQPGSVGAPGDLEQLLGADSASVSALLADQTKEGLTDVIRALTQYHLIRGSVPYSGEVIPGPVRLDQCQEACSRADALDSEPPGVVEGGFKATVTILLWAILAVGAAWVGPAAVGGRFFATRSEPACGLLAGVIGLGSCGQLEDVYQRLVTGEGFT